MTENYNSELITPITEQTALKSYIIKKTSTVRQVVEELNLEKSFFAVIVNGKRVGMDYQLKEKEELTILPKIAGGIEKLI